MNKIRLSLLACVALFVATSCTIEHTIDYNKDMSGTNQIVIDYADLMSQMSDIMGDSADADKPMDMSDGLGDLEESFEGIKGIDNIQTIDESAEHRMGFTFDFEDTKALNAAMSNYMDDGEAKKKKKSPKSYVQKKKALIINFADQDLGGVTESLGDPSMLAMLGMFDYELTINMPMAIKSADNPLYTLSENRKSLKAIVSLEAMTNGSEDLSTKIKW